MINKSDTMRHGVITDCWILVEMRPHFKNEIFQSSSSMYKKSYGSKLAMQYLEQGAHFKGDFAVSLLIGEVVRILKRW